MIFGGNTAKTGTGKPVTQKIDCYESPDSAIRIYDSKGYETNESGDQDFFNDVIGMVKNPAQHSINIIARISSLIENLQKKRKSFKF